MSVDTYTTAASFVLIGLLAPGSLTYAQEPKPATPAAKPEVNLATQEELTGDWGGERSRLKQKGVELEFKFYKFAIYRILAWQCDHRYLVQKMS